MKQYLQNGADPNICIQNDTQLYVTIKNCNIESFELLIDNGADLSHRDKYGTTPSILIETFINNDNAYIYEKNIWTDMLKMIDNNPYFSSEEQIAEPPNKYMKLV